MNYSVGKKLSHLINGLHFKLDELGEVRKLYAGEPFNVDDAGVKKLLAVSNELCNRFEELGKRRHKTWFGYKFDQIKRIFVLRKLFCGRWMLADVRSGIRLVIGFVDAPSLTFFNYDAHFGNALVTMGRGVEIAPKVRIGENRPLRDFAESGLPKIEIGKDVWIGLGAEIKNGVKIGEACVVGAGATVEEDIEDYSLAVGRPAKVKRKINRNEKENRFGKGSPFTPEEESVLLQAVRKWSKISEIKFHCILSGWQFNLLDGKLMAIYNTTHAICEGLNGESVTDEERQKALNDLFPLRGENFSIGKNFHLDMLGTAKIGKNVTICDGAIFGGNIVLGDNVTIGENACLFASGHPVYNKRRKMNFKFKYGVVQIGQNDLIVVKDGVTIGKNAIVTPGSVVTSDVPDGAIYAKNKIVQ